jgi:hypothetical protein
MNRSTRYSTPIAVALALAAGMAGPVAAQTTVGAGGGSFVQSWGKDATTANTQTYGQSVTVPLDNILNSFSFWLGPTSTNFPDPANPSLSFMAYVYAFDAGSSHAVGPALYTSSVYTYNATPTSAFTEYTFNTGGLSLNTGDLYALFLSTSGLSGTGHIQWEAATSDEYAGGNFIFQNNGEDVSSWTTDPWGTGYASDLHFEATFGPSAGVPEPSAWMLLVAGLLGLGMAARRRRVAA